MGWGGCGAAPLRMVWCGAALQRSGARGCPHGGVGWGMWCSSPVQVWHSAPMRWRALHACALRLCLEMVDNGPHAADLSVPSFNYHTGPFPCFLDGWQVQSAERRLLAKQWRIKERTAAGKWGTEAGEWLSWLSLRKGLRVCWAGKL